MVHSRTRRQWQRLARLAFLPLLALCALSVVTATSCKRADTLYCDENTPCTDPDRPFCDLNGSTAAANGIARTCVASPFPDLDAGFDAGPDAREVCSISDECDAVLPICVDNMCAACTFGAAGDAACEARSPDTPSCGQDGRCKQCLSSDQCLASVPYCEPSTGTCVPCDANSECQSGVCNVSLGTCEDSANIVYVDSGQGIDGPNCGDGIGFTACETLSGAEGALAKVAGARNFVVMAAGNYTETVDVEALSAQIIGNGASIFPPGGASGPTFRVRGASTLSLDDLRISGGVGIASGHGIDCENSELRLNEVRVDNNAAAGIGASGCNIFVDDSQIESNDAEGLDLSESSLEMSTSAILGNGFQGLVCKGGSVQIRRTLFVRNSAGGLFAEDCGFALQNDIIVRNGNAGANPADPAGGIRIADGNQAGTKLIEFCTVADNTGPSNIDSGGIICGDEDVILRNSIVVGNSTPPSPNQTAGSCTITFSMVTGISGANGNISSQPNFVDAANEDYHLSPGSPGIDQAEPNATPTEDFDGDPRPNGARSDMGADEQP